MIVGNPIVPDSAGLNFDVIQCSDETMLPATAEENTIAVFTNTEISSWAFAFAEPIGPIDGMVWINTSSYSGVAFNALKENCIFVCPTLAKQYVNGSWVSVNIRIFQEGIWRALELVFFENGAFNTNIFGHPAVFTGRIVDNGTIMMAGNNEILTSKLVDLTHYGIFQFDITTYNHGRIYVELRGSDGTAKASSVQLSGSGANASGQVYSAGTFSIDVSGVNEPCYIYIKCYVNNYNSDISYLGTMKFLP